MKPSSVKTQEIYKRKKEEQPAQKETAAEQNTQAEILPSQVINANLMYYLKIQEMKKKKPLYFPTAQYGLTFNEQLLAQRKAEQQNQEFKKQKLIQKLKQQEMKSLMPKQVMSNFENDTFYDNKRLKQLEAIYSASSRITNTAPTETLNSTPLRPWNGQFLNPADLKQQSILSLINNSLLLH